MVQQRGLERRILLARGKTFEAKGTLKILGKQFHAGHYDGMLSNFCCHEVTLPTFPDLIWAGGLLGRETASRPLASSGSDSASVLSRCRHRSARHREKVAIYRNGSSLGRLGITKWQNEERLMLIRSFALAAALAVSGSAFAQGVSDKTPGHKMQDATKSTAPGASEYAPGHKMQNAKKSTAPGSSEYAPGRQQTTGSNTKR